MKIIAFDLGGVLLDFSHKTISTNLSGVTGIEESLIFDFIFKSGIEHDFDTGKITGEQFYAGLREHFTVHLSYESFKRNWNEIFRVNQGMPELLEKLKAKGYRLFLLSNTNELHFPYCQNTFGFLKIFDEFLLSYKLGIRKPSPEIFQKLKSYSNNEIIFIDDIMDNVVAAQKEGIDAIRFTSREELEDIFRKKRII